MSLFFVWQVVVSFLVSPRLCGGSHKYSCTYQLIDPTRPNPQQPVVLTVFASNLDDFPHCTRAGDVILCIDVKVELIKGFVKLVGSNASQHFAFVVFSRKVNYITGFPRINTRQDNRDQIDSTWGFHNNEWEIYPSHRRRKAYPITSSKVEEMNSWSECQFLQSQVGGSSKCELSLDQAFTYTSTKEKGMGNGMLNSWASDIRGRCDVICLVAAVIGPECSSQGRECSSVGTDPLHHCH